MDPQRQSTRSGGGSPCHPSTGTLGSLQDPQLRLEVTGHSQGSREAPADTHQATSEMGTKLGRRDSRGVTMSSLPDSPVEARMDWDPGQGTQPVCESQPAGSQGPYGGVRRVSKGPVPTSGHSSAMTLAPPHPPHNSPPSPSLERPPGLPEKAGACHSTPGQPQAGARIWEVPVRKWW